MSAAEVIAMIEKLPPHEKAEVIAFARNIPAAEPGQPNFRYATDEAFNKVLPEIFEKHHELFRRLAQ